MIREGNMNFTEEHTGLADVQIETEILLTAMKASKNVKDKRENAFENLYPGGVFCCGAFYLLVI